MKWTIAVLAGAALAGCATPAPPSNEEVIEANTPLYCDGPEQCNLMWRRAQLWIVNNSRWKIQSATDVVIETYNPPDYSIFRAYRITREPLSGGREQIKIASGCKNVFRCDPDTPEAAAASFKRYVRQSL